MEERRKQDLTAEADGIIEGRNAVIEALRAEMCIRDSTCTVSAGVRERRSSGSW